MDKNNNVESNRPLILYGAGEFCKGALQTLKNNGVIPAAICDSNPMKNDSVFEGYCVKNFETILEEYDDFDVLITALRKYDEIKEFLLKQGIEKERISQIGFIKEKETAELKSLLAEKRESFQYVYEHLEDKPSKETYENIIKAFYYGKCSYFTDIVSKEQYFEPELIHLSEEEFFCDAGGYDGDTLKEFIAKTNNKFSKYYCFEPEQANCKKIKHFVSDTYGEDNRIHLYDCGLYSENGEIGFDSNTGNGDNKIDINSSNKIKISRLDDVKDIEKITFLKMDIEGSELKALEGAKETILKHRPKLAISVYHKKEDLIEIPRFIMNLGLDYKYYVRHYGRSPMWQYETVFYAI